jgi:dTDP-4-amino-4,6-dideoxygalactose transaminase
MRNIKFSPPDIGQDEIDEVVDTLKSGWITTGPKTKLFEKQLTDYCGSDKTVCLSSATAGMELTFRMLGIGEGDEVITSAYTYTASASAICHAGATPVLVDTAPNSYMMDLNQLESAVTARTKAIIPVDIAGVMANYSGIKALAQDKANLFSPANDLQEAFGRVIILADAAHSLGAEQAGVRSGAAADFSSFSFHAVKNLTTGEGGAVSWKTDDKADSDEIYRQFQLLSLHGQSKDAFAKTMLGSWEYDIVAPYYKNNMTDITASLGIAQLRRYGNILRRRHEIAGRYNAACNALGLEHIAHEGEGFRSSAHLYIVRLTGRSEQERNEFIVRMAERGVPCNVHYKPLPMHSAYRSMGFDIADFPNAFDMYKNSVTIPLHTCLSDEDAEYIIETMTECLS